MSSQRSAEENRRGVELGRLFGITVVLDWSLLIIAALITSTMALGLLGQWHPNWSPALRWLIGFLAAVLLFTSVLIHEFSHALMARRYGTLVERITLFIFGGMAHMEEEPQHWRAEMMIAIVGPITSLILGILFMVSAGFLIEPGALDQQQSPEALFQNLSPLATLLFWAGNVNIILAIFNLVPAFPLDGGRVLRAILWGVSGNYMDATRLASSGGRFFGWLLVTAGIFMVLGIPVPFFGVGIGGLWLVFIGWFLTRVATASYQQASVKESLAKVPVADIMRSELDTVSPALSIASLVEDYILARGQRGLVVMDASNLVGMVSFEDVRRVKQERWQQTQVADIMTRRDRLLTLEADDDSFHALAELSAANVNQMPVLRHGELVGLLRREDVLRWLQLYRGDQIKLPG